MSTTASSASPTVVRSQSTSSRSHSYRPPASDFPPRTRSVAVRPSTSSHSPHHQHQRQNYHSHSKSHSHSYDRRPPTNDAVFDSIARRDFESSRGPDPATSHRDSSEHRARDPTAYRSDSTKRHRRNNSSHSSHRKSVGMTAAAPVMAEGVSGPPQPVPPSHLHHQASSAQPKRRTTITTPSGQWALGKTIGAGSMGKVKLAKNLETGEQVRPPIAAEHTHAQEIKPDTNYYCRWLLRLFQDSRPKTSAAHGKRKGPIAQRKSEQREKQRLSVWSTTHIYAA